MIAFPIYLPGATSDFELAPDIKVQRAERNFSYQETPHGFWFGLSSDERQFILGAEWLLQAPTYQRAQHCNLAMRLQDQCNVSLSIGFDEANTMHKVPISNFGEAGFQFDNDGIAAVSRTLEGIERISQDKANTKARAKFQLMGGLLEYACRRFLSPDRRLLELCIILEMLLLPEQSAELSYRFSLRLARLLQSQGEDVDKAFAMAKRVYKERSAIVHSGESTHARELLPWVQLRTRRLLRTYLATPQTFEDQALDRLCLS